MALKSGLVDGRSCYSECLEGPLQQEVDGAPSNDE